MITSTSNQQIKNIIKLQKSASQRRKQGLFVVEGDRLFREAPRDLVTRVFATQEYETRFGKSLEGYDYELVSPDVYRAMSDTLSPQGILAVVRPLSYSLREVVTGARLGETTTQIPALLLLENIQDPGNLGTIVRMAEGAGITGMILSHDTVDMYNSKVVRATMGSVFRVPFYYVSDVADAVRFLKEQGIVTYAAHLNGHSMYDADFQGGCCVFIGNEGNGLTPELTALAEEQIRIPMRGQVESLNAATAATVFAYEMLRQRMSNIS